MRRWTVRDRYGNEIYLTEERWRHIISRHNELDGHLEDVLTALKRGRRKQDAILPYKYTYFWRCDTLPDHFNRIVVKVVFRPNNSFVVTAWPDYG